jgi:hypothetical protein
MLRNLGSVPSLRASRPRVLALAAVLLLALTAAAGAPWTPGASGDGDPASDVLLGESVFYPYTPPVSAATTKTLNAWAAAAAKAHFNLKVALIASPVDLGVIPDLFGKPQKYAEFLDQEISFQSTHQPLLVVMKAGYGVAGVTPAVSAAAAQLPKPAGGTSQRLAEAAIVAIKRLAAASGHRLAPIRAASAAHSSGGSSPSTPLLIVLIGCAVLAAGALVVLRQRGGGVPEG